jgi:biotin operon repressor
MAERGAGHHGKRHGADSADELAKATGWQRHTVLGALSRLRSRGFEMQLRDQDGKKAYRLDRAEA